MVGPVVRGAPSFLMVEVDSCFVRTPRAREEDEVVPSFEDDEDIPPDGDRGVGEPVHGERREEDEGEGGPVRVHPRAERALALAPAPREPAAGDLEREGDEDGEREVLLGEALLDHLERGHGRVGLEPDLGDQQEDEEGLDVCTG